MAKENRKGGEEREGGGGEGECGSAGARVICQRTNGCWYIVSLDAEESLGTRCCYNEWSKRYRSNGKVP